MGGAESSRQDLCQDRPHHDKARTDNADIHLDSRPGGDTLRIRWHCFFRISRPFLHLLNSGMQVDPGMVLTQPCWHLLLTRSLDGDNSEDRRDDSAKVYASAPHIFNRILQGRQCLLTVSHT